MPNRPTSFLPLTCLAVLLLMLGIVDARAQLLRASPSLVIKSGDFAFGSDAAYDPVNRMYLVVMAKELQVAPYGTLVGRFVDSTGTPVGSEFVIQIGWVNLPRVIYSADVVTQTGSGGFIVTWGDFPADTLGGRTVTFPGIVGTSVLSIGAGYGVHEVAYSATSRILGTAWTNHTAPHTTRFSRLPVPHNIASASTALQRVMGAGRPSCGIRSPTWPGMGRETSSGFFT